jgi:6-phosphogluconolactonase
MFTRIVRLASPQDVADVVAQRFLTRVTELLKEQDEANVCLTGGGTADLVYERFAELAPAALDLKRLHLWWGDERFVAATDPDRNSLQAISRLGRALPIQSASIHMMAAKEGRADPHDCAAEYAAELGDTHFDITFLGMGPDGHVASIFPGHPSMDPTSRTVIGVTESPKPPSERISLTLNTLNRSGEIWFIVTGAAKADALVRAIEGDKSLPASYPRGAQATYWFVDEAAAAKLPQRHTCPV